MKRVVQEKEKDLCHHANPLLALVTTSTIPVTDSLNLAENATRKYSMAVARDSQTPPAAIFGEKAVLRTQLAATQVQRKVSLIALKSVMAHMAGDERYGSIAVDFRHPATDQIKNIDVAALGLDKVYSLTRAAQDPPMATQKFNAPAHNIIAAIPCHGEDLAVARRRGVAACQSSTAVSREKEKNLNPTTTKRAAIASMEVTRSGDIAVTALLRENAAATAATKTSGIAAKNVTKATNALAYDLITMATGAADINDGVAGIEDDTATQEKIRSDATTQTILCLSAQTILCLPA
ncbi:hypothetical protein ACH5RR_039582 [Cinchona calisaya]|uniref:Uncharacterized protein n=1 Tax=Cinchona calisaya TaxID=153742 RepID=A0ABD2XYP4_9GENT